MTAFLLSFQLVVDFPLQNSAHPARCPLKLKPREGKIAEDTKSYRPIPEDMLRKLFDHARWLNSNGRAGAMLQDEDLDLTRCMLDGVSLQGAQIPNVRLTGSSLRFAQFSEANLADGSLMFCNLDQADFSGATLRDALFLHSTYETAVFTEADVTGACWTDDDVDPPPTNEL